MPNAVVLDETTLVRVETVLEATAAEVEVTAMVRESLN